MKAKTQRCPDCGGAGLICLDAEYMTLSKCPRCKGTGKVKAKKQIEKPDQITLKVDTLTAERILHVLEMTNRFASDIGTATREMLGAEQEFREAYIEATK